MPNRHMIFLVLGEGRYDEFFAKKPGRRFGGWRWLVAANSALASLCEISNAAHQLVVTDYFSFEINRFWTVKKMIIQIVK